MNRSTRGPSTWGGWPSVSTMDYKTIQSAVEKVGAVALLALVLWWMGGKADLFLNHHLAAMAEQTTALKAISADQRTATEAQAAVASMMSRFMDLNRDPSVYETTATNEALELIAEQVDRIAKATGVDTSDLLDRVRRILDRPP